MMSEIHNILEQILDVDGHIRIRPYQVELHSQLQHTILWQTQKNSGLCISHYGDESWLEGNHYETENNYWILVYYRPQTVRYDKLIACRKFAANR